MRILRVIDSMDPEKGGPSQGIRNSIHELEKIGVSNEVVCLDDPAGVFIKKSSFKIHALGSAKGPWAYNKELKWWLTRHMNEYDVVIIHGLWLYHSYITSKIWRGFRKETKKDLPDLYVMPHGMLDPYFQKEKGRKLKAIRNWLYWKLIEGKTINKANGILFTCEEELRLARQTFSLYHPLKELNIGYGTLEPEIYTDSMKNAFADQCGGVLKRSYLLFLSRVHPKKGVDILIKAYKTLKKDNINLPDLVIAGPGMNSGYGKELLQLADGDPSILFPGMLQGDSKLGAFYGCEAFILPSHQENFGIAVAEALSCSKPVLITNKVNIWREIEAGNAGLIAEDTIAGVSGLLLKWSKLTEPQKKMMEDSARKLFEADFSVSNSAVRMKNILFSQKSNIQHAG